MNRKLLFYIFSLSLLSCTSRVVEVPSKIEKPKSKTIVNANHASSRTSEESQARELSFQKYIWETWEIEKNVDKSEIQNVILLQGDQAIKENKRREAFEIYSNALEQELELNEKHSAVARLVGTLLSLGEAKSGLREVSYYFKKQGKSVAEADYAFSFLLAFLYAENKDLDQSIAWFSKAYSLNGNREVKNSLKSLIKSLVDEQFFKVKSQWKEDPFVNALLLDETKTRSYGEDSRPSWSALAPVIQTYYVKNQVNSPSISSSSKYICLLPFTGKYRNLGEKVFSGISLALENHGISQFVKEDTGGNPEQTISVINKYKEDPDTKIFIGPLSSASVVNTANEIKTNSNDYMFTFSKAKKLMTGDRIFRVAPTAEQQSRSLVRQGVNKLKLRNVAIVYPQNPVGLDFANTFKSELVKNGIKVEYEMAYIENRSEDLLRIANDIEYYDIDGLFFPGSLGEFNNFISTVSAKKRNSIRFLGTARWSDEKEIERSKNILQGIVFITPFFKASDKAKTREFVSKFVSKFDSEPDFLSAQAYDLMEILLRAKANGSDLSKELSRIRSYEGITGKFRVEGNGEIIRQFDVLELGEDGLKELGVKATPLYTLRGDSSLEVIE